MAENKSMAKSLKAVLAYIDQKRKTGELPQRTQKEGFYDASIRAKESAKKFGEHCDTMKANLEKSADHLGDMGEVLPNLIRNGARANEVMDQIGTELDKLEGNIENYKKSPQYQAELETYRQNQEVARLGKEYQDAIDDARLAINFELFNQECNEIERRGE